MNCFRKKPLGCLRTTSSNVSSFAEPFDGHISKAGHEQDKMVNIN